eukprot:UN27570
MMTENNEKLKKLDSERADKDKECAVWKTKVELAQKTVKNAKASLKEHDNEVNQFDQNAKSLQEDLERATLSYSKVKEEHDKIKDSIDSMEGQLSGLSGDGMNKGTLKEQLMNKKKELSELNSKIKRIELSMKTWDKEMRTKKNQSSKGKQRWERLTKENKPRNKNWKLL